MHIRGSMNAKLYIRSMEGSNYYDIGTKNNSRGSGQFKAWGL